MGAPKTILIVEDTDLVRRLLVEMLSSSGHELLQASSSASGAALAKEHPGRIDLLITDVAMAGRSGPELANEVRGLRPGIEVLFISGYARGSLGLKGMSDADTLLSKPFSADQLDAAVAALLGT